MSIVSFFGCKRLCLDRYDQLAVMALDKVGNEMKASKWLQELRMIKYVLKKSYTKDQWQEMH